jgi:2-haloacid dehalogenase
VARIAEDEGRVLEPGERTAMSESLAGWPAFADVPDSLAQLRQRGWRLGILSNCDRDLVASSIPRLGVPFDEVVVAEDVHSYKPATGHWQEFRRRTGAEPASHVHVAQSLFHDIAPANELGLRSVWINRLAERPGPQPTRELPDLTGLADVLDDLVAR